MNLEYILQEFGKKNGLGQLQLKASGKCSVVVNNHLVVTFESSLVDQGFFIYSVISEVPIEREKELYLIALKGNLFHKETGGGSIGYHESSNSLILFFYLEEEEIKYSVFEKKFENFISHLVYWKNKIASPDNENRDTPKDDDLKIFYA